MRWTIDELNEKLKSVKGLFKDHLEEAITKHKVDLNVYEVDGLKVIQGVIMELLDEFDETSKSSVLETIEEEEDEMASEDDEASAPPTTTTTTSSTTTTTTTTAEITTTTRLFPMFTHTNEQLQPVISPASPTPASGDTARKKRKSARSSAGACCEARHRIGNTIETQWKNSKGQ